MLECCAFGGGFVLGAGCVAGRGNCSTEENLLYSCQTIFLPDLLCQFSIVRRRAKRGARILGGKNMKTLRCRCETVFLDGVELLSSATGATAPVTLPHSWVVLTSKNHEVAQRSFNTNFPQMPQIPAFLPDQGTALSEPRVRQTEF